MTPAYQAPPMPLAEGPGLQRSIQRPSSKFLMQRAVEQIRLTQQPVTPTRPAQPAVSPPQRIPIDWEARLQEAHARIAMARKTQITAAVKAQTIRRMSTAIEQAAAPRTPVANARANSARQARRSPRSGSQLYVQRLNALRNGRIYTRLPVDSFYAQWSRATGHPSYWQWRELLALEAKAAGQGKGQNSLTVMVGDSLSQWFPADHLPDRQIWLNQSISGDTTDGILRRLSVLKTAKPDTIYFMAGVNDLKRGASDQEILRNIHQILTRLKQQHPNVQIVVQSILPTRSAHIPNARIAAINPMIHSLTQRHGVDYLDLHRQFRDWDGGLRSELTTDGVHLSALGYQVWQSALNQMDQRLAQRPRNLAQMQAGRQGL